MSVITKSGGNSFHGAVFEYLRNDALDARNHFDSLRAVDDSVISEGPKSPLKQNQFGGSIGGPIVKDRAFFFGSYEGYRLDAGKNLVEAVPSARPGRAPSRRSQALRPGFTAPGAVILPGASTDPDFDIAQLQDDAEGPENAFSGRFDCSMNQNWSSYVRVFHDQGTNDEPEGVTGRRLHFTDNPTNAVFNLQGLLGGGMINEFKFGYNAAPSTYVAASRQPASRTSLVSALTERWRTAASPGRAERPACATPGGLVRVNSAATAAARPYDPVLADLRRLAEPCRGHPLLEVRRRRPADPDDHRSAGRHHLHLLQPQRVPRQHADAGFSTSAT